MGRKGGRAGRGGNSGKGRKGGKSGKGRDGGKSGKGGKGGRSGKNDRTGRESDRNSHGSCGLCGRPLRRSGCSVHGSEGGGYDRHHFHSTSSQSGAFWMMALGGFTFIALTAGLVLGLGTPFSQAQALALPATILSLLAVFFRYDMHLAERWGLRECGSCGLGSAPGARYCAHCGERLGTGMFRPHKTKMARRDGSLASRKWYGGRAGAATVVLLLASWGLAGFSAYHLQVYGSVVSLNIEDAEVFEGASGSGDDRIHIYTLTLDLRNDGGATADSEDITVRLQSLEERPDASIPGGVATFDLTEIFVWGDVGGGDLEGLESGEADLTVTLEGTVDHFIVTVLYKGEREDSREVRF